MEDAGDFVRTIYLTQRRKDEKKYNFHPVGVIQK